MKKNFLLVTGGTGGHVIPAENFSNYLLKKNINCSIMVDKRGYKYINNYIGKIHVIKSSNLNGNLIKKFIGVIQLFFGFVKSFFIILSLKPSTVISFGSYASFSPMLTCIILKQFYKKSRFVKILKIDSLISTNDVINTNNCFISVCKTKYKNKIIILSAIDNLIKGGAGQAIQNMNIKFGFKNDEGFK